MRCGRRSRRRRDGVFLSARRFAVKARIDLAPGPAKQMPSAPPERAEGPRTPVTPVSTHRTRTTRTVPADVRRTWHAGALDPAGRSERWVSVTRGWTGRVSTTAEYLGDVDRMNRSELALFARRLAEIVQADFMGQESQSYVAIIESLARRYDLDNAEVAYGIRIAADLGYLRMEGRSQSRKLTMA